MATTKKKPTKRAKPVKKPIRVVSKVSTVSTFLESRLFGWPYMAFSLIALLGTTFYWSLLGAKLQLGNADQVVDTLLFKNAATLHGSTFPGAHSFLIKWPIYWLVNVFGSTNTAINAFTIGLVLVTVLLLVGVIYLIERRPIVFGTICLGLASVLLLIPAMPYPGAILPVNMAMLSTRNIEYVVFIFSLILLVRTPKIKSWGFWLSAIALSFLIASDKLFLIFAIGGAMVTLIIYAQTKRWVLASLAVNWLIVGLIATVGAYIILAIVGRSGLAHISSQSSVSPYNLTSSLKNLALGGIYGVMGILTNFGSNPAFAANKVRTIPHQFLIHLFSSSGPAYVINLAILAIGLFAVYKVIRAGWLMNPDSKKHQLSKSTMLSIILIWSSVVAIISFVATSHYYAVDARYLTIVLFTVFITLAVYTRTRKWRPEFFVIAGIIILLGMVAGVVGATQNYNNDKAALESQNNHNSLIAQVLYEHNVAVLVGDYWRVVPIKQVADNLDIQSTSSKIAKSVTDRLTKNLKALTILPLSSCGQALQTLSSSTWQSNLNHTKFAYLLSIDDSLTNYPNCSLDQVTSVYGKPDASALIAGTLSHPQELLLFYDQGIPHSTPLAAETSDAAVLPIPLSQLPDTSCAVPSIMNIVAHEDDDLLFMNPDLIHEIDAGDCISTIYVTAGNAGAGEYYWLSREEGAEAAYAYMLGVSNEWTQKIVELAPNEYLTIASPKSTPRISLIFMHLPDGNLQGQGFSSSDFESLAKLKAGQIKVINSVDNQSNYTSAQLINALSTLMNIYQPSGINTQSDVVGSQYTDHSDHLTVNWFVHQAYNQFETQKYANQVTIPIKYYIGYPIHSMAANVSGEELTAKEAVFMTYAKYDSHVCQTLQTCLQNPAYNAYLTRQYQSSD